MLTQHIQIYLIVQFQYTKLVVYKNNQNIILTNNIYKVNKRGRQPQLTYKDKAQLQSNSLLGIRVTSSTKMNIIDQFTNAWKAFCKPPRQNYSGFDLGTPLFQTKGFKCKRREFKVKNKRGYTLECSYYEPVGNPNPDCVVYLHCFNGSRIESIKYAEPAIARGCAFCNFDFSGSGMSEGDYVSLGYYEQDDVQAVIGHLKKEMNVRSIALWGRSMGAVTALMYTQKFPSEVQALAVDSAFVNMWDAGLEIADKKVSLPTFIIKGMLEYVRRQIKSNADYDMNDVNTIKEIAKCHMPVIFVVSKEDKLVSFENSLKLYDRYPESAKKSILYVKGDHNECREWEDIIKVVEFLTNIIRKESLNVMIQNKENSLLLEKNHYNSLIDEQRYQSIMKLTQYQQSQNLNKIANGTSTLSPSTSLNQLGLSKSPACSINSESPANQLYKLPVSHSHSYHSSSSQMSTQNNAQYSTNNQNALVSNNNYNQYQNYGLKIEQTDRKFHHQNSTSNITSDHYQQLGMKGNDDNINVDQKELENNPLVQSLLKDLIQKNYSNEVNQNEMKQQPSTYSLNSYRSQLNNEDYKNQSFSSKINEFDYKQQVVLNRGIQSLQQSLQVQTNIQQSKPQNENNNNISQNPYGNYPYDSYHLKSNSRKSSLITPSSIDVKSSIPDEMQEIDFPKSQDYRTKVNINPYQYQLYSPHETSQNHTGLGEYQISPSPLNDASRKGSLLQEGGVNNLSNTPLTQNQYTSIQKQSNQFYDNNNNFFKHSTTVNNSPQFFVDKAISSPNSIQPQLAPKSLSQTRIEDSINVPQTNTYTYSTSQIQYSPYIPVQHNMQNQSSSQLNQLQQTQSQQTKDQVEGQHHRKSSISKSAIIMNTQESEDIHHLPQSTLTFNMKQYF